MPDPNAHPDDMKSPADYEPKTYTPPTIKDALPPMWWFCPWPVVTALAETIDHLKSTGRGEQAARIAANIDRMKSNEEVAALLVKCDDYARALSKARNDRDSYAMRGQHYEVKFEEAKAELDALKSGEEQALQHANEQLAEARSAYDRLWNAVQAETPDSCFDGHGPAGWMKNVVKQLAEANSAATEYRRQLDAVTSARDQAVEAVEDLDAKLGREQLDHAATLGYVKMAEASLKRWKALAKARGNRLPAKKKKKGVSK
jgi:primosomal protein N''